MNPNARKHYFKEQATEKRKDQAAERLRGQLESAAKVVQLKRRTPLNVDVLSTAQQVELLEAYAMRLEAVAAEFADAWPDKQGQDAVRWIILERGRVLESIAKLQIQIAKGDEPARVR